MRFLFRLILRLILFSPFVLATSVWFALEDTPRVVAQHQLNHQDIARARTIIKHNDPRQLQAGSRQTVRVSQEDLNLAANYLLLRIGGAASVEIRDGSADLIVTTRISESLPVLSKRVMSPAIQRPVSTLMRLFMNMKYVSSAMLI